MLFGVGSEHSFGGEHVHDAVQATCAHDLAWLAIFMELLLRLPAPLRYASMPRAGDSSKSL